MSMIRRFSHQAKDTLGEIGMATAKGGNPFGSMVEGVGGLVSKMGVVGLVAGTAFHTFVGNVEKTMEKVMELRHEAVKLGASMETISTLKFAARDDFETATHGITKLHEKLGEAINGDVEAQKKFTKAGVEWEELAGQPLENQLDLIAKKFGSLGSNEQKAAFAVGLFGKAGAEMIPTLEKMGAGMDALKKKADERGKLFTDQDAIKMKALKEDVEWLSVSRFWDKASLFFATANYEANHGDPRHLEIEAYNKRTQDEKAARAGELASAQANLNLIEERHAETLKKLQDPNHKEVEFLKEVTALYTGAKISLEDYDLTIKKFEDDLSNSLGAIGQKSGPELFIDTLDKIDNAYKKLVASAVKAQAAEEQRAKDAGRGTPEKENAYQNAVVESLARRDEAYKRADEARRRFETNAANAIIPLPPNHLQDYLDRAKEIDEAEKRAKGNADQNHALAEKRRAASLEKFRRDLGIAETPLEHYGTQLTEVKQLEAAGRVEEAKELLGLASQQLAASQKLDEKRPPAGFDLGSAAEFSARNAFQRGDYAQTSPVEAMRSALDRIDSGLKSRDKVNEQLLDALRKGNLTITVVKEQ